MPTDPTVFVIDDDPDVRASLKRLLSAVSLPVETFDSAEQFLEAGREAAPGCLLLDVRMPGMGGLQLLKHLHTLPSHAPVIVVTAHGDVPMVLDAMRSGAIDFIEKPANHQKILDCVHQALKIDQERCARQCESARLTALLGALSKREHEVLERMIAGMANKTIAAELGISERTLEKHRGHILEKMQVDSLAELMGVMLTHRGHGGNRPWTDTAGGGDS